MWLKTAFGAIGRAVRKAVDKSVEIGRASCRERV